MSYSMKLFAKSFCGFLIKSPSTKLFLVIRIYVKIRSSGSHFFLYSYRTLYYHGFLGWLDPVDEKQVAAVLSTIVRSVLFFRPISFWSTPVDWWQCADGYTYSAFRYICRSRTNRSSFGITTNSSSVPRDRICRLSSVPSLKRLATSMVNSYSRPDNLWSSFREKE